MSVDETVPERVEGVAGPGAPKQPSGQLKETERVVATKSAGSMVATAAASSPSTFGICGPLSQSAADGSATNTATSVQPICFSQEAVIVARTPLSSTSTTRAVQVAIWASVSCTS